MRLTACCVVALLACIPVFADTVTQKDGTIFTGTITEETQGTIKMQVERKGMKGLVVIERERIASIQKGVPAAAAVVAPSSRPSTAPAGPIYCPVRVWGSIGDETSASGLASAFQEARRVGSAAVVLDIDSPGGSVPELLKMLGVLEQNRDIRIVAFIRRDAYSAAAMLSLACREIYMRPDAVVGAAVIITDPRLPPAVAEKFVSAKLARERSAIEAARHSPLFVDAMADLEAEVSYQGEGEHAQLVAGSPGGSTLLKAKGKILTVTAKEAVRCGLAVGIVADDQELRAAAHLGTPNLAALTRVSGVAKAEGDAKALADRQQQRREAKEEYRRRYAPQMTALNDELLIIQADKTAALATKSTLRKQYDSELGTLDDAYKTAIKPTPFGEISELNVIKKQAQQNYDDGVALLKQRYQPQIIVIDNRINNAAAAEAAVQAKIKQINDGAPR